MYVTEEVTPCKTNDPDLWFSKDRTEATKIAKHYCGLCPVRDECLASTIRFEQRTGHTQPGVYGGLSESERLVFQRRQTAITP